MKTKLRILIVEDSIYDAELIRHEIQKNEIQYQDLMAESEDEYRKALHDFARECSLNCVSFIYSIFKVNKKLVNYDWPVTNAVCPSFVEL